MTKEERADLCRRIGRLGGKVTAERHGYEHFSRIGTKGGTAWLEKYGRQGFRDLGKKSAASKAARKEANAK